MKGILFNIVEDIVSEAFSADAWDDVIDSSGVAGAYTSLGNYPDDDLAKIVVATAAVTGLSEDATLRLSGRAGFKYLMRRAPYLLEGLDDWKAVLTSLDSIIHPEVLKSDPDADLPRFEIVPDGDALIVTYVSKRDLCVLADGLMLGCGDSFGVELSVEHLTCTNKGGASCTMRVAEDG